jgi:hypothetical protein
MDIKSKFYSIFNLNSNLICKTIKNNINHASATDSVYLDTLSLFSGFSNEITQGFPFKPFFVLGWECAKFILPKICVDSNYVVRVLSFKYHDLFMDGILKYAKKFYPDFDIQYVFIEIDVFNKFKDCNVKLEDNITNITISSKLLFQQFYGEGYEFLEKVLKIKKNVYDGIISWNYKLLKYKKEDGYYLYLGDKNNLQDVILYNFVFSHKCTVYDNPILPVVFILFSTLDHRTYKSMYFSIISVPSEKLYENKSKKYLEKISELDIDKISKIIKTKQEHLLKVDYIELWCNKNPECLSFLTKSDVIDIKEILSTSEKQNHNNQDDEKNDI